ncbi:hypothetical protein ACH5RR_032805 [Cinchona calisaya]|uniref:F-box associated domain-containing protein n=1 Tax=Cinchona calisaya TaxID=153742 RepID=A0ABD2YPF3_9GENT
MEFYIGGLPLPDVKIIDSSNGYDEFNAYYKVFRNCQNGSCMNGKAWLDVYSLKTNSWKTINQSYGGKLYWTTCAECSSVGKIISLDLKDGKYGEVPEYEEPIIECRLEVLGGFLSVFCYYGRGSLSDLGIYSFSDSEEVQYHLDLWIMNYEGVWCKRILD